MTLEEIQSLAAKSAAACEAVIASPEDLERRKTLYVALEPLASWAFEPIDRSMPRHTRGLANQSTFLADTLRNLIEDSFRTDFGRRDAILNLQRSSRGLLKVLNEILGKTG